VVVHTSLYIINRFAAFVTVLKSKHACNGTRAIEIRMSRDREFTNLILP